MGRAGSSPASANPPIVECFMQSESRYDVGVSRSRLAFKLFVLSLGLSGAAGRAPGLWAAATFHQKPVAVPSPNIIILLVDDLGIGDPGCYNPASKIRTPHIDRIAREGMRFTDVHSSSSVCSPTRYAILTGRYAWRGRLKSGVLNGNSRALIEPARPTIASLVKEHGYATAGIGKWHLGFQAFDPRRSEQEQAVEYSQPLRPGPLTVGFDEFFGIPASLDMPPYVFVENDHLIEMPTARVGPSGDAKSTRGPFWRAGPAAPSFRHSDVLPRLTERAVAFLNRQATSADKRP